MIDTQRRRFRFSMKLLFVAVTLLCVLFASIAKPLIESRRQQGLLNRVTAIGGRVSNLGTVVRTLTLGRFILSFFSPSFDRYPLYGFDFSGTKLSDDDLDWVTQVQYVKELNLSGTQVSDAGLRRLRNSEFLTKLDLRNTRVTDQALPDLLTMDILASLSVGGTPMSYKALEQLDAKLMYAHFCEERAIDELKAAGIQVVDPARAVKGENSRGCWIVQAGREAYSVIVGMGRPITLTTPDVVNLGYLQSLRKMTFHTAKLGPTGLDSLPPLSMLKELHIFYVNLTDRDLATIAKQTQLESLAINGCDGVTDEGLAHLKALGNLKALQISGKGISKKAITELGKQLPNCTINRD
jgi:internalin A